MYLSTGRVAFRRIARHRANVAGIKVSGFSHKSGDGGEDEPTLKLWGGRFSGKTDPLMERFNASLSIDKRMWKEDIDGSKAYSAALARSGLLSSVENVKMQEGLEKVAAEWEQGIFVEKSSDEDIHTANERRLTELIGSDVAGKLHTGRSRNDQCLTDFKLWLKNNIPSIVEKIDKHIATIVVRAKEAEENDVIISGYTHLQQAQCVRLAHYLLAYAFMLKRDAEKFRNTLSYVGICPLGSGAIAGHSFFGPDERKSLAADLGFHSVTDNSMDAISNRDFVLDFLYSSSLVSTHLSRLHEDLIIFNTTEFSLVEMSDLYSTGSSLMPQKKNPDASEIVRGKAGEVIGKMVSFFITMKGLPLTYNKDLQDDKKTVFEAFDAISDTISISQRVVETMRIKKLDFTDKSRDNLFATDLADYLVRKGIPFRTAHHLSGECVRAAEEKKCALSELSADDYYSINEVFEADIKNIFDPVQSVEMKNAEGSTSKRSVAEQIAKLEVYLENGSSSV